MLRTSALSLAAAIALTVGCGTSPSSDSLFGPPDPSLWTGARPSTGGTTAAGGANATGGVQAAGGTAAGGADDTGGASTGGVANTGGTTTVGTGGIQPSTGGAAELGSPGVVSCSGIPCRSDVSPASTCCLGNAQTFCRPEVVPCSWYGASAIHCDDAADCGGGAICCASSTGDGLITADCKTECGGSGATAQLCRTNAECTEGRECQIWDKISEYSACQ